LCSKNDRGNVYDRFKGRVIYPVMTLSGKVVAFGGRTLRKDKNVAKYVNSPESIIYRKSYELYGLYQAKQAIVKTDKCILVEGYMDVISMHQVGVENVVASSGTSLTEGQIRLIHRFTNNVTVIYDADPAGIKASLRGIDLLLAEGLDIKVLLLPEGEDPDSFAQTHTTEEVNAYIDEHETDFIKFKTDILLRGTKDDPLKRAGVISDILRSISVIPDAIKRQVYINECSRAFSIDEKVISLQLAKIIAQNAEKKDRRDIVETETAKIEELDVAIPTDKPKDEDSKPESVAQPSEDERLARHQRYLYQFEKALIRYILKYGMLTLCESVDDDGNTVPVSVYQYVMDELGMDNISFTNKLFAHVIELVGNIAMRWNDDFATFQEKAAEHRKSLISNGVEQIRQQASNLSDINLREAKLNEEVDKHIQSVTTDFCRSYISRILLSDPNDDVRAITTELVSERYHLSKVHTKYSHVETEEEKLEDLIPRAIYELKDAHLACAIEDKRQEIKAITVTQNVEQLETLMSELVELTRLKGEFARYLGERIITPRFKS
jgi:DNA primase